MQRSNEGGERDFDLNEGCRNDGLQEGRHGGDAPDQDRNEAEQQQVRAQRECQAQQNDAAH